MIGDVVIFGIYIPALLLLSLGALALTGALIQALQLIGFYRLVSYRPIVDLCAFTYILWLAVLVSSPTGAHP